MPVVNNVKVACKSCIRGHRATSCNHGRDRRLVPVRKPGRPLGGYYSTPALSIPRPRRGCRCGGAKAPNPGEEAREESSAKRRRTGSVPKPIFRQPSSQQPSSQHSAHDATMGSPTSAEPQCVVDHASAPPLSPATGRWNRPFGAPSGPSHSNRTATSTALNCPAGTTTYFSPQRHGNFVTHFLGPSPEIPLSWPPPNLVQTPECAPLRITRPHATQPIGVNLSLCTHCAVQSPGIAPLQVIVLNHLDLTQGWCPGNSPSYQANNDASPQHTTVYVTVQEQRTPAQKELQDQTQTAFCPLQTSIGEIMAPPTSTANISNCGLIPPSACQDRPSHPYMGPLEATVSSPTYTMGERAYNSAYGLQTLLRLPVETSISHALQQNPISPLLVPEQPQWNTDLSWLYLNPGDTMVPPSGYQFEGCTLQYSSGCDLACIID